MNVMSIPKNLPHDGMGGFLAILKINKYSSIYLKTKPSGLQPEQDGILFWKQYSYDIRLF